MGHNLITTAPYIHIDGLLLDHRLLCPSALCHGLPVQFTAYHLYPMAGLLGRQLTLTNPG